MSDTYQGDDDTNLAPGDDPELEQPEDDTDLPADDGGGDDEPVEQPEDEPEPRRESRAAREIRQLRERAQQAEARAARADELEREVRAIRQPPVDPAADERAFQERIANLPYEQQILAVRDRERQIMGQQLQGVQLQLAQVEDRASFSDLKRDNPVAARHSGEVEKRFREFQGKGQFVSREIILKNLLGEIALERGPAAARRSAQQGARRIAAEGGRPSARRGDATPAAARRDDMSLEALEARLKDVRLGDI